jgi:hypothetical protein
MIWKYRDLELLNTSLTKYTGYWILRLVSDSPPLDDDSCTDHVTHSWYVKLQVFVGFWGYQSRWGDQIFLQVFECFLSPLELVMFLEEIKEWESPDAESWDESAQCSHTSRQLLDIMEALGRLHFGDSWHLLWVRVNTTSGDHIPE